MKTIEFSPTKIEMHGEDVDNPFEGKLVIDLPTYKERIAAVQKIGLSDSAVENAGKIIDLVYLYCKGVQLTHKDSQSKFENLDDLSYSEEGSALINAAGRLILNGVQLGKK